MIIDMILLCILEPLPASQPSISWRTSHRPGARESMLIHLRLSAHYVHQLQVSMNAAADLHLEVETSPSDSEIISEGTY